MLNLGCNRYDCLRNAYACLARGLSFKVGGGAVITLCPPLTVSDSELHMAFDIIDASLSACRT